MLSEAPTTPVRSVPSIETFLCILAICNPRQFTLKVKLCLTFLLAELKTLDEITNGKICFIRTVFYVYICSILLSCKGHFTSLEFIFVFNEIKFCQRCFRYFWLTIHLSKRDVLSHNYFTASPSVGKGIYKNFN